MRHARPQRTALAALLVSAALCVPATARDGGAPPGAWPHLARVEAAFAAEDVAACAKLLRELGPASAPAAWGVLCGRGTSAGLELDARTAREALRAVLDRWPADVVIPALVAAPDARTTPTDRLTLVELLAWTDDSDALPAIFAVLAELEPVAQHGRRVAAQLGEALDVLLESEPHRYRVLEQELERTTGPLRTAVLRHVARRTTLEAGRLLAGAVRRHPECETLLLEQFLRARRPATRSRAEVLDDVARRALASDSLARRRVGVAVLAELGRADVFDDLIELLSEPGSLGAAAADALGELTGLRRDWDAAAWRTWRTRERDRLDADREAARGIETLPPSDAVARTGKLSAHRLYAAEAVNALAPALRHPDAGVRRVACDGLGRLDHADALDVLIPALDDGDAGVRRTALGVLRRMTGRDLGSEARDWADWWDGLR